VALPFELNACIEQWAGLRAAMARGCPEPFARDEWAYLISFLDPQNLRRPFLSAFGAPSDPGFPDILVRPRGTVAIWLPGNVSLLGPLMLILTSLTGNRQLLKSGVRADDSAMAFLAYARRHMPPGPLAEYLVDCVRAEQFDRNDPQNAEFSAAADIRIVFGSDASAAAVEALPHRSDGVFIPFVDHRSEAWIEAGRINRETIETLIKVFNVYGRTGCTSPARVVLLDGSRESAEAFRDALISTWPEVVRHSPPMHVASENIMARQVAAAQGWDASTAGRHAATIAVGDCALPTTVGRWTLPIIWADVDQAVATMPGNIQTIGHALDKPNDLAWLTLLAGKSVKRFVPLARMHHFGTVWDGQDLLAGLFAQVSLS
jgi:hypothetical protein